MRRQVALAAAWAAPAAFAVGLGDIDVRSRLGEPLDARIPIATATGERVHVRCFALRRDAPAALTRIGEARLELRRSATATILHVRSRSPLAEPAMALGIAFECDGLAAQAREYEVLLDPPRNAAAVPSIASLKAQPGDTLESIARAIYPRERAVRISYIAALRADNPALATLGERDPITPDVAIALPDLRLFAGVAAAAQPAVAAHTTVRDAPAPREAPAAATPRARSPVAAVPQAAGAGFRLKLSAPEMDLSRSRGIDDRTRAGLRERRVVLDADDETAALLALRDRVQQLEARVSELQLKLSRETAGAKERPAAKGPEPAKEAVLARETAPTKAPARASEPTPAAAQPMRVVPNAAPDRSSWRDGPGLIAALIGGIVLAGALLVAWARNRGRAEQDTGTDPEAWPETVMDAGPLRASAPRAEEEQPIEIALPLPATAPEAEAPSAVH